MPCIPCAHHPNHPQDWWPANLCECHSWELCHGSPEKQRNAAASPNRPQPAWPLVISSTSTWIHSSSSSASFSQNVSGHSWETYRAHDVWSKNCWREAKIQIVSWSTPSSPKPPNRLLKGRAPSLPQLSLLDSLSFGPGHSECDSPLLKYSKWFEGHFSSWGIWLWHPLLARHWLCTRLRTYRCRINVSCQKLQTGSVLGRAEISWQGRWIDSGQQNPDFWHAGCTQPWRTLAHLQMVAKMMLVSAQPRIGLHPTGR